MSLPPLDGGHGGGGAHVGVVEVGAAALAAGVEDPAAVVVVGLSLHMEDEIRSPTKLTFSPQVQFLWSIDLS
jgi:hypothetical protein